MRTTKTVSISLPPEQFKAGERLAKKQNRTVSGVLREGPRRLQMEKKRGTNNELLAVLQAVQGQARRAGLNRMTMRDIDAEIAAARRARAGKPETK